MYRTKTFVLTQDVKNPCVDRRRTRSSYADEVFKAGQFIVISTHKRDGPEYRELKFLKDHAYVRHSDYTETFKAIEPFLKPVEDSFESVLREADAGTDSMLFMLLQKGKISLEDIRGMQDEYHALEQGPEEVMEAFHKAQGLPHKG